MGGQESRESVALEAVDDRQPFLPISSTTTAPTDPSPIVNGRTAPPPSTYSSPPKSRLFRAVTPERLGVLVVGLVVLLALWGVSRSGNNRVSHAIASTGGKVGGWTGWSDSNPLRNVRERPLLADNALATTVCTEPDAVRYGLVIDAGSQGSRIHVYKFNSCAQKQGKAGAMPELEDELFVARKGGLSQFAGRARQAADSLKELMDAALQRVPEPLHKCTPVVVKATAGLRLTGEKEAKEILDAVRTLLSTQYPFPLADAPGHNAVEIMDGSEEAVYAWITVNYLLGRIGGQHDSAPTAAVLDLGGASTQIVFEPRKVGSAPDAKTMRPGAHIYELRNLAGTNRALYQNSYLGYGLMQARQAVHALSAFLHGLAQARNPQRPSTEGIVPHHCLTRDSNKEVNVTLLPPAAFAAGIASSQVASTKGVETAHVFQGTALGPEACQAVVDTVLDKQAPCLEGPCAFAGVYQPSLVKSLPDGSPVVALSYFYDRLAPLGLAPTFTVSQLGQLVRDVCQDSSQWPARWPTDRYPEALKELHDRPESCLDTTYLYTLLKLG